MYIFCSVSIKKFDLSNKSFFLGYKEMLQLHLLLLWSAKYISSNVFYWHLYHLHTLLKAKNSPTAVFNKVTSKEKLSFKRRNKGFHLQSFNIFRAAFIEIFVSRFRFVLVFVLNIIWMSLLTFLSVCPLSVELLWTTSNYKTFYYAKYFK